MCTASVVNFESEAGKRGYCFTKSPKRAFVLKRKLNTRVQIGLRCRRAMSDVPDCTPKTGHQLATIFAGGLLVVRARVTFFLLRDRCPCDATENRPPGRATAAGRALQAAPALAPADLHAQAHCELT